MGLVITFGFMANIHGGTFENVLYQQKKHLEGMFGHKVQKLHACPSKEGAKHYPLIPSIHKLM